MGLAVKIHNREWFKENKDLQDTGYGKSGMLDIIFTFDMTKYCGKWLKLDDNKIGDGHQFDDWMFKEVKEAEEAEETEESDTYLFSYFELRTHDKASMYIRTTYRATIKEVFTSDTFPFKEFEIFNTWNEKRPSTYFQGINLNYITSIRRIDKPTS